MELIVNFLETQPWYNIVTASIALASAIAAITPTPKKGTFLAKVYTLIDFLAINFGRAKDKGE